MNIKIESGAHVQITDNPIVNVFGDVVQHKEVHIHPEKKTSYAEEAEVVEEVDAQPRTTEQKVAACFTAGLLSVEDTSRLYFLLLAMWARRQLQSKELPAFVRMVAEAYPALLEDGRTQEKVITDLQNMNKKATHFFDKAVRDQASLIDFVDEMYPKRKNGERSKYGEEAVTLANQLFLAMK